MEMMIETIKDKDVVDAITRSITLSFYAGLLSFLMGTPLAYLLARKQIVGKKIVEGIIDLPIMIPHPVVGIAILSLSGRNQPIGKLLAEFGVQIIGNPHRYHQCALVCGPSLLHQYGESRF